MKIHVSLLLILAFALGAPALAADLRQTTQWPQSPYACELLMQAEKARAPKTYRELLGVELKRQLDLANKAVLAQDINRELMAAPTLDAAMEIVDTLVKLGERIDTFRNRGGSENQYPQIMNSVDFIAPLVRFRAHIGAEEQLILRSNLVYLMAIPRVIGDRGALEVLNFKLITLFFEPEKALEYAKEVVEADALIMQNLQSAYRKGPSMPIFSPSAASALRSLPPQQVTALTEYLQPLITEQNALQKGYESVELFVKAADAAAKRRNAEMLLNYVRVGDLRFLVGALSAEGLTLDRVAGAVEEAWRRRNGHASEVSFHTVLDMAKALQKAIREMKIEGDAYWFGSFPNGRPKRETSDMDLYFGAKATEELVGDFEEGTHGTIDVDNPVGLRGNTRARFLAEARMAINRQLLGRQWYNAPLFALLGMDSMFRGDDALTSQHRALFRYGSLNQFLSIRITADRIYLEIYDGPTFTNWELDLTALPN